MTTSTRNASAVREVRPWLLAAGVVLLLIAGQVAIEFISVRGKPLSVAMIDVSRQRLFGQEFIRQVRQAASSSQAQGRVRLRQAIDSLRQSRDTLAAYDFEHALRGAALAEVEAKRRDVLATLDRVLDYSQPGIVGTITMVPEALGDELLRAQEDLLGSLAARISAADRDFTFWRRSFEFVNVLLLAFVLALGVRQSLRNRERETRTLRSERQELHESNTLLLELYNESPVMLYSIDTEARIVRANEAWLGKMGYSLEEVVGRETREFMTAGKRAELAEVCRGQPLHPDLLEHGRVTNLKVHFETAGGETLYASISAKLVRDEYGEPHGAHCIIIDETEHTLAVKDLDRAQARLFDTFATMPVPMFHIDPGGRFLRANAATLRAFGVKDIGALNALGHEDLFAVAAHRVMNNGTGLMASEPQFLVDARGRGLEVHLNLRLIDDRDEPFLEGVFVDVTSLETARRAASLSREHYRRLYDTTPVMMCSVDTHG
ncbi:MAG: PAS domain S-box protein, partial [Pseudomonadota bacterium]